MNETARSAPLAPLVHGLTLEPIGARRTEKTEASFTDGVAAFSGPGVTYRIDTRSEAVRCGLLEITAQPENGEAFTAVTGAGAVMKEGSACLEASFDAETGALTLADEAAQLRYTLRRKGRSLFMEAAGGNGFSAFETGRCAGLPGTHIHSCIYVEEVSIACAGDVFVSAYLDKAQSSATKLTNAPQELADGAVHGMRAAYETNSAGETNPLYERFYLTVSDEFLDCAYLTNAKKSARRDELNTRVIYDNWHFTSSYTERMEKYAALADRCGLKDVLLVEHRWQRDQLDISNPAHYPASTHWGSEESFLQYLDTIRRKGWKTALHEDYWFIQPSAANQYWNRIRDYFPELSRVEDAVAQNADGTLRIGWSIPGTDYVSYASRSDMMAKYIALESPQIKAAYDPEASFVDVNGGVDPLYLNQVTLNADSPYARTLAQVTDDTVTMLEALRNIYGGPVISEGAQGERSFGSAYAGWLDSGSREITDCHNCRIMPDYELRMIRPLMANQGMGPLARFQVNTPLKDFDMDRYNAACLAYGHAGFIGDLHYDTADEAYSEEQMVKTYYLFRAIQEQYLDTENRVLCIDYYTPDGRRMGLNEAIRSDYDFRTARLMIAYENGLTVYLNFSDSIWKVTLNGRVYELDRNAFAAENPAEDFCEYSCMMGGRRVDFVRCRKYRYFNDRSGEPAQIVNFE